jgi:IMP dehydrogenase
VRPLDDVTGYLVPDGSPARPLTGTLARSGLLLPGPSEVLPNAVDTGTWLTRNIRLRVPLVSAGLAAGIVVCGELAWHA